MSDSDNEEPDIGDVLQRIGNGEFVEVFKSQNVTIDQVEYMTEEDFKRLGIETIGMRLKIKQACHNFLKGNPSSSPVVKKFMDLSQGKRKKGSRNGRRNDVKFVKQTRRVYVGWKHQGTKGAFKLVPVNKGGGTQVLDLPKNTTYIEMTNKICNCYFPGGLSRWQGLNLKDLNYYIGTYTGEAITNEETFTFGKFMEGQTTFPIRIYMHTETANLTTMVTSIAATHNEDTDSLPDLEQPLPPSTIWSANPSPQAANPSSQTANPSSQTANPSPQTANPSPQTNNSFVDAGTPTVQLRLSLSRRHSQRPRYSEPQHHQTQPVPNIVEILDSEDEELQIALIESLESSEAIVNVPDIQTDLVPEDNLQSVLKAFQVETVDEESVTKLLVMRSDVLNTALKGFNRKKINFKSSLYVKFSGELGEDQGGPRRELFRLAMKALPDSGFFEGPENTKIFSHNLSLLDKEQYRIIGRLIALSLVQDGPGIHFIHPDLYNLMVGKPSKMEDLDELLPATTCDMLQQLRDADDEGKKDQFLSRHADHLLDLGITNVYHLVRHEKAKLIHIIKKQYIYYRITGEISQFTSGMNDVNFAWDMVKTHAELFEPLFCFHPKEITGEEMIGLFQINYSLMGSNDRALEDVSVFGWESFLQSVEAGDIDVTLSEVLAFVTGADCIPPCGFSKLIDVDFYTCEGRLPSASTCALQLWLPRVNDPDIIAQLMYRALKESYGFMKI